MNDGSGGTLLGNDKAKRHHFSVTSLMVYEACPYQYRINFIEGKPPPITPAMRRGTSIHAVIAGYLRQPALFPPEVSADLKGLLETFLQSRFNLPPVHIEQPFDLSFEGGEAHGRIDLVLPGRDGGLELVDFKSGRTRPREELMGRLQLPLYTMATARIHDISAERTSYTYFFLGDGVEVHVTPDADTFNRLRSRVERIILSIQDERFDATPGCRCYACRGEFGRPRPGAKGWSR